MAGKFKIFEQWRESETIIRFICFQAGEHLSLPLNTSLQSAAFGCGKVFVDICVRSSDWQLDYRGATERVERGTHEEMLNNTFSTSKCRTLYLYFQKGELKFTVCTEYIFLAIAL